VEDNPRLSWCTGADCEATAECLVERRADDALDVACTCGATFCFNCHEEAHRPVGGGRPGGAAGGAAGLAAHLWRVRACGMPGCCACRTPAAAASQSRPPTRLDPLGPPTHPAAQVSCATVRKWLTKNSAESENLNWILANTKPCPKCHRPIEKNQGCMHMTCSQCR
jgi:hypothetical protein